MSTPITHRATSPDDVLALQRHAAIVRRCAHPNVVKIVGQRFGMTSGDLYLQRPEGTPLDRTALSPADQALLRSQLLDALHHLHRQGVAHGSIAVPNIVVAPDGKFATLIGFEHATPNATGADVRADLSALDRLLPPRTDGGTRAYAAKKSTDLRSTMVSKSSRGHHRRASWSIRQHLALSGALTAAVVALGFGALAVVHAPQRGNRAAVAAPSCPTHSQRHFAADIDGDGCADAIDVGAGTVMINGDQYTVGEPDDALTIGRWTATARPTLALLQHTTGNVFVFDEWPAVGTDQPARLIGTAVGGAALKAVRQQDGSDALVAIDDYGLEKQIGGAGS